MKVLSIENWNLIPFTKFLSELMLMYHKNICIPQVPFHPSLIWIWCKNHPDQYQEDQNQVNIGYTFSEALFTSPFNLADVVRKTKKRQNFCQITMSFFSALKKYFNPLIAVKCLFHWTGKILNTIDWTLNPFIREILWIFK